MGFLKQIIINGLTGAVMGAVVIGIFAFLVAGSAGILNGLAFGGALGLMAGMSLTGFAGGTYWWTGVASRFGERYQEKERGEDQK